MAHKSGEPGRLIRKKISIPRNRGEKYLAPPIFEYGERPETEPPRRMAARKGEAHELVRRLKPKEVLGLRRT